jgi:GNAT superfamily N-acetyltransferase
MLPIERVRSVETIDTVAALAREIWNQHFPPIIGQPQVDYMLATFQSSMAITEQIRERGYEYYLVFDDGEHVGYFAIVPDEATQSMLLSKLYLRQANRGRGLGRTIVDWIEQECVVRGFRKLWLTVNKENAVSIAFYERIGFTTEEAMVTDIGEGFVMDDYRMVKVID